MRFLEQKRFRWAAAFVVTVAAIGGAVAVAPRFDAPPEAAPLPAGAGAMQVAIDPETGELVPAADDANADKTTAKMFDRSHEGLVVEQRPDGRKHVDLEGRFMSAAVARIGADGKVETKCFESEAEAAAFLNGAAASDTTPPTEVR